MTPTEPQTSASQVNQSPDPGNVVASYTDDNMAEMSEEEKAKQAEYMYLFEGPLSIIEETNEPEEDMTNKNSMKSSSLMMIRMDSQATATCRDSLEPFAQKPGSS